MTTRAELSASTAMRWPTPFSPVARVAQRRVARIWARATRRRPSKRWLERRRNSPPLVIAGSAAGILNQAGVPPDSTDDEGLNDGRYSPRKGKGNTRMPDRWTQCLQEDDKNTLVCVTNVEK